MTNEQQKAKELAVLLTAFADGKQLEYKAFDNELWEDFLEPTIKRISSIPIDRLRIKPETKRIALNQQDLIDRELSSKTNNIIFGGDVFTCLCFGNTSVHYKIVVSNTNVINDTLCFWYDKMKDLIFADNSPCYKEVECER